LLHRSSQPIANLNIKFRVSEELAHSHMATEKKMPKSFSTLGRVVRKMNGFRHTRGGVSIFVISDLYRPVLIGPIATKPNTEVINEIPDDLEGSPRMPTKELGDLSLAGDTTLASIPDMDEIPDMEEDDEATAAPVLKAVSSG
jgi:hypothetical protein